MEAVVSGVSTSVYLSLAVTRGKMTSLYPYKTTPTDAVPTTTGMDVGIGRDGVTY